MKMKNIDLELILRDLKNKIHSMKEDFNKLDHETRQEYTTFANQLSSIENRYARLLERSLLTK